MKRSLTRRELLSAMGVSGTAFGLAGCGGGSVKTKLPGGPVVATPTPTPTATPTPSPSPSTGTRVERFAFVENELGLSYIASVRADGSDYRRVPIAGFRGITDMDWSRDGKRIAFQVEDETPANLNPKLYIVNSDGSGLRQIGRGSYPNWHPDSRRLAYVSYSQSTHSVWSQVKAIDVTGDINVSLLLPPTISPLYLFIDGNAPGGFYRYTNPQWVSASSDDVLVSLWNSVLVSDSTQTSIELFGSGGKVRNGSLNDEAVGEVVALGHTAPDGSYSFLVTHIGPSSFDRVDRFYLHRNGTDIALTESLDGVYLFSPDSTRILTYAISSSRTGLSISTIGKSDYQPAPIPQRVFSWFYE